MADESQLGNNNNWWDSSRTTRFDQSAQTPSSSSATLNCTPSFGSWPTEMVDSIKAARGSSSVDSLSVSGSSMFLSDQRLMPPSAAQESSSSVAAGGGGALADPNLQFMGLGLSSQGMDWNQPLFRDEKAENSSFRSMLQEGMSSNTYFHHHQESVVPSTHEQWRHNKLYAVANNSDDSSTNNDYKHLTHQRGFSLDQPYSDTNVAPTTFPVDSSGTEYGNQQMFQPSSYQTSYSSMNNDSGELMMTPNEPKFPQFLVRGSSQLEQQQQSVGQLQFSNSAPFWNATATAAMDDVRSSFFPSLQTQLTTHTFDEKQKNTSSSEVRNIGATVNKKSSSETSNKRPRNESASPLPAFKVRKEKMGDRITALQQLVSPFGKTDTASVLSEAIEYIKFLHEQVNVLSTPYMRSGPFVQNQQQSCDMKAEVPEAQKQDLRSRGLCLVPISSTFPVTHETTVDFWTPTFGGTFR
ncbi:basic helix-loop-helix transcription factor [Lithospermum erythrorhizon]|uniref:Basic helix-loop-helix transcription factor n=1 Tax=Lithospermum erythrorhizon TaxID=34254 RepID=A0AAV3P2J2_LITER